MVAVAKSIVAAILIVVPTAVVITHISEQLTRNKARRVVEGRTWPIAGAGNWEEGKQSPLETWSQQPRRSPRRCRPMSFAMDPRIPLLLMEHYKKSNSEGPKNALAKRSQSE